MHYFVTIVYNVTSGNAINLLGTAIASDSFLDRQITVIYIEYVQKIEKFSLSLQSGHVHYCLTFQTNFRVGKQQP